MPSSRTLYLLVESRRRTSPGVVKMKRTARLVPLTILLFFHFGAGGGSAQSLPWDRTNYFETLQASDDNLRWALDLEADRMVNSFIRKTDLESEFTVVRNEFEASENNPISVLLQRAWAASYLWHPYGRSVIGNRA